MHESFALLSQEILKPYFPENQVLDYGIPEAEVEHFSKAVHLAPNSAIDYANLGVNYRKLGKNEEAMKSLLFKDTDGMTALKPSDVKGINKDVTLLVEPWKGVYKAAKDLDRLGKVKSAPAQMAMVFKYMKALDPTSVVRESEYASARPQSVDWPPRKAGSMQGAYPAIPRPETSHIPE